MDQLSFKQRLSALANVPRLFRLVYKTSPGLTLTSVLLRLCLSFLPVVMLYIAKIIIDQAVLLHNHHSASQAYLWKAITVECVLFIVLNSLTRTVRLVENLLSDRYANSSTISLIAHAASLDLDQFEDAVFYDKLERARNQTTGRTVLLAQVLSQLQGLITVSSLAISLFLLNPWFLLILIFGAIPSFAGEYYFNSKNYLLTRSQMQKRRELQYLSFMGASDQTAKEVRVFDLAPFIGNRFRVIARHLHLDIKKLETNRTIWGILLDLLGIAAYYSAFIYIIVRVINGLLSIGDLTFLIGSIRTLSSVLQGVMQGFSQTSQGALYLRDYFEFFEIKPRIANSQQPRPFPKPIREGFVFDNVGFRYFNSKQWANRHVSFTLHAGEKLALVGENGAGKTTLVKLLARLYDPTEGRILLDGHDLKEYDITELRANIGIIFQDYLRYQMTAAENISMGNIGQIQNREQIMKAAKQSLASIMIERLPKKYDQMLGRHFDTGVELSGGEWQKVALARAYMRDAQLMVLDEPTAALDARAEYEVFERFSELTENKTAILISHRFSTVRMADRIMVLENGEIKEVGSHNELLIKDGRYAELFNLQAMGYK